MKLRFWPTTLISLGLYLACAFGGNAIINSLYYYPGPGTKSAFLGSYSPQSTLDSFEIKQFNTATGSSMGSGAGRRFVSNDRSIEPKFAMRSDQRADLLEALRQNLEAQLRANHAEILSECGDVSRGFHFTYRIGQNLGSATIAPFAAYDKVVRHYALPNGVMDVSGKITIAERWFPREENAVEASFNLR